MNNLSALYLEACNGNESAFSFCTYFSKYCHAIDDIIDGDKTDPEFILSTFSLACTLFGHPFYMQNIHRLQMTVQLITSAYADSVAWEKSDKHSHKTCADVLRLSAIEMLFAVSIICGGYDHLRKISATVRELNWNAHHDKDGIPV